MDLKKENWTEDEILALPSGESDRFDRKSGQLFSNNLDDNLAKALSAFSNSGGGHLILGVKDDGTIDGVETFVGKARTREWLEQKIPHLLAPTLQDFRVHEVEKSNDSRVPQDRVIIVIDVGDSNAAPHQSSRNNRYYHRVGSHSKDAPHHFLDLLWKREKYPGLEIASVWVYEVINPLISLFKAELSYLSGRHWNFKRLRPADSRDLQQIHPRYYSGNFEQFYEFHPELFGFIEHHDQMVNTFTENLEKYYSAIKRSQAMNGIVAHTTSSEALEKLKDKEYAEWNHKIQDCKTTTNIYETIFSQLSDLQIKEVLAELVVNGDSKIRDNSFAPYWNVYSGNYLKLYDAPCDQKTNFEISRRKLAEITENLIQEFNEKRKFFCLKYRILYEKSQKNLYS